MNINFFTNIFSNLNFGAAKRASRGAAHKKPNPSQVIRKEAEDIFERRYERCSSRLDEEHTKHEKPKLKFLNNQFEEYSGFYYIGDNSLYLNIAAFNHLNLIRIHKDGAKRPVIGLLSDQDIKGCLQDRLFTKDELEVFPIGAPERQIMLETTIDHELEHFKHFHRILNSKEGKEKFIKKGMKRVPPRDMRYLLRFQPDVRFLLSDAIQLPRLKIYKRSQYNGFDILASICKGADYKDSATEILARMNEIAAIEKRLKADNLTETERGTLCALKDENVNILKKDCL